MRRSLHALWVALSLAGCSDTSQAPPASGAPAEGAAPGPAPAGPGTNVQSSDACSDLEPMASPLRRLTRLEYNRSVRDLLGVELDPADEFPADPIGHGFNNNAALQSVSPLLAEGYMLAAEMLAAEAVRDLGRLLPCDPAGAEACAREFISSFGRRAYRRPLADTEIEGLVALYRQGAATSFEHGIELVLRALLQSIHFLYRFEFGSQSDATETLVPLTQYEVATRLSYFLWATTPDPSLLEQAEAGALASREAIAAAARAMLADPRAEPMLEDFHEQWLGLAGLVQLGKNPSAYPEFTPGLRDALSGETAAFVSYVFRQTDARLETLLGSPVALVNAASAPIYGAPGVSGDAFQLVELDAGQRSGLLTQASVLSVHALADQSSPVHRGKLIREKFLCQELPPVPANLVVTPPDLDPNLSTRERFERHASDPACSTCHALMDPIGLGFEHYDGIGRYRSEEAGRTVDASGRLVATREIDGPFDGVIELANRLGSSAEVHECVIKQWFRYALGRIEGDGDACSLAEVGHVFSEHGHDLREALVALAQSDAFLFRRRITPEELSP